MPLYNEFTQKFEFSNGNVDIECVSMGELIANVREFTGINLLTILN